MFTRLRCLSLLTAACAALTVVLTSPGAQATKPRYQEYVALGDSWTADVVFIGTGGYATAEYAPLGCLQSSANYPKQVAKVLGVPKFHDASCGAATTKHFTSPQAVIGGMNPPQLSRLTSKTDLVTVGIGGNDAGLAAAVVDCLSLTGGLVPGLPYPLGRGCREKWTVGGVDKMSRAIKAAEPKVAASLRRIHQLAPRASVFVVNYLAGIREPGCYPLQPASNSDQVWLAKKLRELNAMLARAAKTGRAKLVDTYTPSIGRDACALPNVRYVEGFIPASVNQPAIAVPFHPNSAGADAQAALVVSAITR